MEKYLFFTIFFFLVVLWAGKIEAHTKAKDTQVLITQEIEPLYPIGEFFWDAGDTLNFLWTSLDNYTGNYTLKIIEVPLNSQIPDPLPNTGLFFSNTDITDTSFVYLPTAPVFQSNFRYAWQVETTNPVNGLIERGSIIEILQFPCLTISPILPNNQFCPGDCFTLTGSISSSVFGPRNIYVETDHPNASTVLVNGSIAHEWGTLDDNGYQNVSHQTSSFSPNYSVEICLEEGSSDPFSIKLLAVSESFYCNIFNSCCQGEYVYEVEVADVTNYSDVELQLKQYPSVSENLTEICTGDPAYYDLGVPEFNDATVSWDYCDNNCNDPINWIPITSFTSATFTLPVYPEADELWFDCNLPTNTQGSINRTFRATISTIDSNGNECEYMTEYTVNICCPITNAIVEVVPDILCIGEDPMSINFNVSLSSTHPFIDPPGSEIDIEWFLGGGNLNQMDQTSFEVGLLLGQNDNQYFKAVITNCAGKVFEVRKDIIITPEPKCGTIVGISPNLIEVTPAPGEPITYEICDDDDAKIGVDEPFDNCVQHWQYSSDNVEWTNVPLGTSNDEQNTNVLFVDPYNPIYYRIECQPLGPGCDPCYSNVIKIQERTEFETPTISGEDVVCMGETSDLLITNFDAELSYTWLCNGLEVSSSNPLTADKDSDYWVVATDGCYTKESEKFHLSVCEVIPIISCPISPNECACLGELITIDASESSSSCMGELQYEWSWDGGDFIGPQLTTIPSVGGSTFMLTVTDLDSGCSATASLTIVPCDKP